jgi:hypothetical protein
MSYETLTLFLTLSLLGIFVLLFSRTLNTSKDEKWKEGFWFREALYGPPGYTRTVVTMLGVISLVVGVIGVFVVLFFP